MSAFDPIVVPLDGSAAAVKGLRCAAWLAANLSATLHIVSARRAPLPPQDALRRLRVPDNLWGSVLLHQSERFPEQAVLDVATRCGAGLIVMTARGRSSEEREGEGPLLGHVTASIVENANVPVLVLPSAYRERLPWTTVLVPISGEAQADAALTIAVRLGHELDLELTVVHVMSLAARRKGGLAAEARYADALHHEYPCRLDELVERALSHCDRQQAECIKEVLLRRGDVATALLEVVEERKASVVVVGWHARFTARRARILKALLDGVSCPLLLVRAEPPPPFELRVGEVLE